MVWQLDTRGCDCGPAGRISALKRRIGDVGGGTRSRTVDRELTRRIDPNQGAQRMPHGARREDVERIAEDFDAVWVRERRQFPSDQISEVTGHAEHESVARHHRSVHRLPDAGEFCDALREADIVGK